MFISCLPPDILLIILNKFDNITYINFRNTSKNFNKISYNTTKYLPSVMKAYFWVPVFNKEKYQICNCSQIFINDNPYRNDTIKRNSCIYENYVHELREIKFFKNIPQKIDCQLFYKKLNYPNQSFFRKFELTKNKYYLCYKDDKYLITNSNNKNYQENILKNTIITGSVN